MDPLIGSALIGTGGDLLGGLVSAFGANKANKKALNLQRDVLANQMELAYKGHRIAMNDMKAAGLNPMLAYENGAAKGSPSAGYSPRNELEGFAGLGSSALQARQIAAQTKLIEANAESAQKDAVIKGTEADVVQWLIDQSKKLFANSAQSIDVKPLPPLKGDKGKMDVSGDAHRIGGLSEGQKNWIVNRLGDVWKFMNRDIGK